MKTEYIKSILMLVAIVLLTTLFMMLFAIRGLQDQIDHLQERQEVLTQQLQEMNRYVQYPGG